MTDQYPHAAVPHTYEGLQGAEAERFRNANQAVDWIADTLPELALFDLEDKKQHRPGNYHGREPFRQGVPVEVAEAMLAQGVRVSYEQSYRQIDRSTVQLSFTDDAGGGWAVRNDRMYDKKDKKGGDKSVDDTSISYTTASGRDESPYRTLVWRQGFIEAQRVDRGGSNDRRRYVVTRNELNELDDVRHDPAGGTHFSEDTDQIQADKQFVELASTMRSALLSVMARIDPERMESIERRLKEYDDGKKSVLKRLLGRIGLA